MDREVRQAGNALALLVGVNALGPYLPQQLAASPVLLQEIAAGAPSELLERRPDILAAERNMAAATADVGVATAELYPRFDLGGLLGIRGFGGELAGVPPADGAGKKARRRGPIRRRSGALRADRAAGRARAGSGVDGIWPDAAAARQPGAGGDAQQPGSRSGATALP
ncbi:hypothetical protein G6F65_020517 [Rhizopus arrhizus]|nr:hypothetical protein G6F65_020517 [Rhizopus arrhizus]